MLSIFSLVPSAVLQPHALALHRAPVPFCATRAPLPVALADVSEANKVQKDLEECIIEATTDAEIDACVQEASTIFTMQPRDDGWNNVRDAIEDFKKDRKGAIDQLTGYTDTINSTPVVRWTKVLAGELVDNIKTPSDAPPAPKLQLPNVPLPGVRLLSEEEEQAILTSSKYKTDKQRQVALNMRRLAALIPQKEK